MINSIIQALFHKNSAQYEWARKESMICLTLKLSWKNFQNNWSFFIASIKPRRGIIEKTIVTFSSKYWLAIEEERNKMLEEFILKACWYNNWKKSDGHIE